LIALRVNARAAGIEYLGHLDLNGALQNMQIYEGRIMNDISIIFTIFIVQMINDHIMSRTVGFKRVWRGAISDNQMKQARNI
jgi:hypothetical protein